MENEPNPIIPDGCILSADGALLMVNAEGAMWPIGKVKPQHKLEDDTVRRLIKVARKINEAMVELKDMTLGDVAAFQETVAEKYNAKRGGAQGNITLRSFDGSLAVRIKISKAIEFGAELQAAKLLIDECIEAWSKGANDNLKVLINDAFQVSKEGNIDTARVLGLRRLEVEDDDIAADKWATAMTAISEAVREKSSKTHVYFYDVDPDLGEQAISLSMATA